MAHFVDLTGRRYGKLVVIKRVDNSKNGTSCWLCECDCGNQTIIPCTKLTGGYTKSCGCLKRSVNGESKTRLYRIWKGMHARCENPKRDHYQRYGGRGITVCAEWSNFFVFKAWALENGYLEELSIDRIDFEGNYEPKNCRWLNQREQMQNISTNRHITFNEKIYTVSQFADLIGVPVYTIKNHLNAGWSVEKMIERHNYE